MASGNAWGSQFSPSCCCISSLPVRSQQSCTCCLFSDSPDPVHRAPKDCWLCDGLQPSDTRQIKNAGESADQLVFALPALVLASTFLFHHLRAARQFLSRVVHPTLHTEPRARLPEAFPTPSLPWVSLSWMHSLQLMSSPD